MRILELAFLEFSYIPQSSYISTRRYKQIGCPVVSAWTRNEEFSVHVLSYFFRIQGIDILQTNDSAPLICSSANSYTSKITDEKRTAVQAEIEMVTKSLVHPQQNSNLTIPNLVNTITSLHGLYSIQTICLPSIPGTANRSYCIPINTLIGLNKFVNNFFKPQSLEKEIDNGKNLATFTPKFMISNNVDKILLEIRSLIPNNPPVILVHMLPVYESYTGILMNGRYLSDAIIKAFLAVTRETSTEAYIFDSFSLGISTIHGYNFIMMNKHMEKMNCKMFQKLNSSQDMLMLVHGPGESGKGIAHWVLFLKNLWKN